MINLFEFGAYLSLKTYPLQLQAKYETACRLKITVQNIFEDQLT